jgi:hypothetical protein
MSLVLGFGLAFDCGNEQGLGPYSTLIKKTEKDIKEMAKKVNDLCGKFLLPQFLLLFFKPLQFLLMYRLIVDSPASGSSSISRQKKIW